MWAQVLVASRFVKVLQRETSARSFQCWSRDHQGTPAIPELSPQARGELGYLSVLMGDSHLSLGITCDITMTLQPEAIIV